MEAENNKKRQEYEKTQIKPKKGWFGGWFGGKSKEVQELEQAAPSIELTEEQRIAIYETIDYDEATSEVDMPKDVCWLFLWR